MDLRDRRTRARARLAALVATLLLGACGGGGEGASTEDDPVLRPGDVVTVSQACQDAFEAGHVREQAGTPTPEAFLASVQACSGLAEWSAAARDFGVRLNGQEPRFVNSVCTSAGDAATQASPICVQAKAEA